MAEINLQEAFKSKAKFSELMEDTPAQITQELSNYPKADKEKTMNEELKDRTMFGTKVLNHQTHEVGLLLYTWVNVFADGKVLYATCVDKNGKNYNIAMDLISPLED